jgi:YHS domain-containing protein
VAHNFRNDWGMLWKEITLGFLLAGFVGQIHNEFFNSLFVHNANHVLRAVENVIVGPIVAVLSFVCSVGNVPLAAVLWSGGISFGGVVAFLFADLIVLPILAAYRKFYGTEYALRITALMFVTIVIAALLVDAVFGGLSLIPHARPSRGDIFGQVEVNYKLFTNLAGLGLFGALMALTLRRGVTDPVCGMRVDRHKAIRMDLAGKTYYFCSEHCRHGYELRQREGQTAGPGESRHA